MTGKVMEQNDPTNAYFALRYCALKRQTEHALVTFIVESDEVRYAANAIPYVNPEEQVRLAERVEEVGDIRMAQKVLGYDGLPVAVYTKMEEIVERCA